MRESIDEEIRFLVTLLTASAGVEIEEAALILLNLGRPYAVSNGQVVFTLDDGEKLPIDVTEGIGVQSLLDHMAARITDQRIDIVRYIKHNFSTLLLDHKRSSLGKYYTPEHLVDVIDQLVRPLVRVDSHVLDLAAGCGAFLGRFESNPTIAADIDRNAVLMLRSLGFCSVIHDNSLLNVSRSKYELRESDHVVVLGNPPYNDMTSRNKRYGQRAKPRTATPMDADIRTSDLGISFLRASDKLKADVVCVLHPLSYLIKRTNLTRKLGRFMQNYRLKAGVVFSSHEFGEIQRIPFPVVAALYERTPEGMDYGYIQDFGFCILGQHRRFVLSQIETIDGYIRKYPPNQREKCRKSDIGLYMHNIRDTNSLLSIGYLTEKEDFERNITIHFQDLYKYAYLNCMRRYFGKDFLFGNVSPIVDRYALDTDPFLQDAFVIDTILNNQGISAFARNNEGSIVHSRGLAREYGEKQAGCPSRHPDIYGLFLAFVRGELFDPRPLQEFISSYFTHLKRQMIPDTGHCSLSSRTIARKPSFRRTEYHESQLQLL